MYCEVPCWGENGKWKKINFPKKLHADTSLVFILTQGTESRVTET